MKRAILLLAPCSALLLSGCIVASAARTAVDVATLPVKVASRGVDLATTSQAEADQNRGRELRRREQRLGALERDHERLARKCQAGDAAACAEDERVSQEIAALLPTVPVERD
jgi:Skp family chaperone for outer membrane proteins